MMAKVSLMELTLDNLKLFAERKSRRLNSSDKLRTLLGRTEFYESLDLKYGIIYNFDSLSFGKLKDLTLDLDNIMEARFFNEDEEIVIKIDENNLKGNIFIDLGEKVFYIEDNFFLKKNYAKNDNQYESVKVKKYMDLDEDKQAYVFYLKPCAFIREA